MEQKTIDLATMSTRELLYALQNGFMTDSVRDLFFVELYQRADEIELTKAEQQFTGYDHLFKGGDVISLIESMGLKKEEWQQLKADMPWLEKSLIEDVDTHFAVEE